MADEFSIQRKNLLPGLKKIDRDEWISASEKLGCVITQRTGGSSHYAIRKEGIPFTDIRGLIATVYKKMNKIPQVNQKVFKDFLKKGIKEDDLWRALGLLKR